MARSLGRMKQKNSAENTLQSGQKHTKKAKNTQKRTFFEKNPQKICTVSEMAVLLHRFSEINLRTANRDVAQSG